MEVGWKCAPTHNGLFAFHSGYIPVAMGALLYIALLAHFTFGCSTKMIGLDASVFVDSYFWGTYKSNLYFGIRAATPNSPIIGVMWYNQDDIDGLNKIRHECRIEDHLTNWGWVQHDGQQYGVQTIHDQEANVKLTFKMIKSSNELGWNTRIYVDPIDSTRHFHIKLIIYVSYDTLPGKFVREIDDDQLFLAGQSDDVGNFLLRVSSDDYGQIASKPITRVAKVGVGSSWKMKEVYRQALDQDQETIDDPNIYMYEYNIQSQRAHVSTFDDYSFEIKAQRLSDEFNKRLTSTFAMDRWMSQHKLLAQYSLSNLLGGIIYLHGTSFILLHEGGHHRIVESEARVLYTDTPSRTTFARGFLWDSGFNNLLIQEWDYKITLKILTSWLSLMDNDGWIAREQIPGAEARQNVPQSLCIQNSQYCNPPALLLPINRLIERLDSMDSADRKEVADFLKRSYDSFKKNFYWYLSTQHGHGSCGTLSFRWRGRSTHHTLTSGLDDYPRADLPDEHEMHVDLSSWMAIAALIMSKYATMVGDLIEAYKFKTIHDQIVLTIETLHWDDEAGYYTDILLDGDKVTHIRHFGYVSLFPLLFGLASERRAMMLLEKVKHQLLTDYGIRSLSPSSPYYMHGDQYWTGPIWLNINYLFLNALYTKYRHLPDAIDLYKQVRMGLIKTISESYKQTGFIWEQYSDTSGKGQRSHPFTGWTALIILIMAEMYQEF